MRIGKLDGGTGYSGGQEKDRIVRLKENMSVFGMQFEELQKAAQKAGRLFQPVEEGAEAFIERDMTRRDADLQSTTRRPRQRHPPSASLSARGGGRGERGRGVEGMGERGGRGEGGLLSCPR